MERLAQLRTELKRRRVLRALVGWGVFAFAVLQVYEPVMHGLHLPEWTLSLVVVALAAGFPATVLLAWVFDTRSGGIERTPPDPEPAGGQRRQLRGPWLTVALVAMGLLATAPGLAWHFLWPKEPQGRPASSATGVAAVATTPTIAVLPFVNLSGDPTQGYLGDGITEEITSRLMRLRGLTVAARTSAAKYRGSGRSAREIGAELGVAYLSEGSVRRAGDRIRVSSSLVRTSDGMQIWSDDQDARIDDIFTVQERVAGHIVDALGVKISPGEASALASWGTRDAAAYEEFLKGLARYGEGLEDPANLAAAISHYERALAVDPSFAPAVAALAIAEALKYRDVDSDPRLLQHAEALAERALALDPQLPTAIKAAADVRAMRFDYLGAADQYRRIVAEVPRDHVAWDQLCWALSYARPPRLDEAAAACRRALEIQPTFPASHYHLLRVSVLRGDLPAAEANLAALRGVSDVQYRKAAEFWIGMARGRPRDALTALEGRTTNIDAAWRAMARAQLGDLDGGFQALEEALAAGYRDVPDLHTTPYYEPMRTDPRWATRLRAHGIEP